MPPDTQELKPALSTLKPTVPETRAKVTETPEMVYKRELQEFNKAFLEAQKDMPTIKKDAANSHFKNKYATLGAILEEVLPVLHKNSFILVQSPINDVDRVGVETVIRHTNGMSAVSEFTMQLSKNDPQGAGSAITYARRYALVSMLGLNTEDDDDGNAASGPKKEDDFPLPDVPDNTTKRR